MTNLHHCINYVLKAFAECAVEELLQKTSDSSYLLLHLMIVSYVAYIPESENSLSVKSGNQIAMSCHMGEIKKGKLFFEN